MGLSSLHLDAFFAAARALNFSQAAKELHITQSALSQRIKALEEDLGLTLFVRMPRGVKLTDVGGRVLRYCQARFSLERELMESLTGSAEAGMGGLLRIGGYSSVVRSVLMPALAPLLRENPNVQAHIQSAEMRELPELLLTGQVDFIVTDNDIHRADIESVRLGEEEYVMVQSVAHELDRPTYLDHDPDDPVTEQFLSRQSGKVPDYKRSYMDEIYAIADGVALGLGNAVLSRHIAQQDSRIRIIEGLKPMLVQVQLHYHKQPYYTQLHKMVVGTLKDECPVLLRGE